MPETILIADDTKSNIYMLADILKNQYKIIPAVGGEAAIRLLEQKQPNLVLLDVSMPDIDGFDVLTYMKARTYLANIPVIFVTGEHDTGFEEKGLTLGAVDYIKKPYNAAVVDVKVRNHLELASYRNNLEDLVRERTNALEGLTRELSASREAIIIGMSLMSERHDKVTGRHIERIKRFTAVLVDETLVRYPALLTPELGRQIVLFSPLHDIGKIGISDMILKKKDVLTYDEFNIMKSHTTEGAELLRETARFLADGKDISDLHVAIEIAECHHEKYDGTGYPKGLKGDELPISARIVTLADVYDALRSPRPYKKAFTHEQAMSIMLNGDSRVERKHFDPRLLKVFEAVSESFRAIFDKCQAEANG